jgi:hypothetical protein
MRFRKSIKIAPGIKLNLSKSGISTTIGGRGVSVNVGSKGTCLNTGIPGTGLSGRVRIKEYNTGNRQVLTNSEMPFEGSLFKLSISYYKAKGYKTFRNIFVIGIIMLFLFLPIGCIMTLISIILYIQWIQSPAKKALNAVREAKEYHRQGDFTNVLRKLELAQTQYPSPVLANEISSYQSEYIEIEVCQSLRPFVSGI